MSWTELRYDTDIVRALRTPGGHLSIGRGGFTLHYEHARLSGYACDVIAAYRKAGAEVINVPDHPEYDGMFDAVPPGPAADLIEFWLNHVRAHGA